MRRLAVLIAIVLACCCASEAALAGKRVALVIGNSAYQNVNPLANPANDAGAFAEMLKKAGFDAVDSRRDLNSADMRKALRDFTGKARGADIAVIYFAGHGLEVAGTNYAVPIDATLERDLDVDDEAVSLTRLLLAEEPATKLRLVILDACRDNPFAKKMKRTLALRGIGRGLVGVEATRPNTFIAYAANQGETAFDGDGRNSPFTTALLKHLTRPGLDIRKAFGFIRDDVMGSTGGQQEPYTTNSLGGDDVALVPAPEKPEVPAVGPNAEVRRDYELAERVGTVEAWDSFVAAHPTGFYADLAKAQRNKLAAETARLQATERARVAAEEQARLAAEGAKAAEQAKAAQQAKEAEAARLAAEKTKRDEEARLAAAEAVKRAEQQRLAAEEAKKDKQAEQAKVAAIEPPKAADQATPAKPSEPAVATLSPADAKPAPQPPADLPRQLQTELKRVGCKSGEVDDNWSASARKALSSFNDSAGTKFDVKLASVDALDAVRAKQGRVCPLDCDRGFKANGDHCVKITCDGDQVLGPNGVCRPKPERAPKAATRARSGGGRKCFVYGGSSFCE
jgi:uncharacterized caspase-like protein